MSNRLSAFEVPTNSGPPASFSLLATGYNRMFEDFNWNGETTEDDGHSISESYQDPVETKRKATFGGSVLRTVSGVRKTILGVTVFTLLGNVELGRMKNFRIQGVTETDDGSGGADLDEYPNAQLTRISLSGELLITNIAAYSELMASSDVADREGNISITTPGFATVFPGRISGSSHSINRGRIQREAVNIRSKGVVTSATGDVVLVSAFTGESGGAFSIDTGAGLYEAVGGAIITQFDIDVQEGRVIRDNFGFQVCGPWTFTPPS